MLETAPFDAIARFYDDDYRNYRADLDLLLALAGEQDGPILEAGCGTGRALLPLAHNNHVVTGVDTCAALLDVARAKIAANKMDKWITLIEDDVKDVTLERQDFAFAFCISNTLMHLPTQAAQLALLQNLYVHLRPGALLMLDLFNPDPARLLAISGLQELADRWRDSATGAEVLKWSVRNIDLAEQTQETLFIYEEIFADGAVRRTLIPFTLRFLWRSELELMLRLAGFQIEAILGDFDGEPYDHASDRLIALARKA